MAQIETRWAYIQMLWGICGIGMRRCSQADRRYADCGLRIFDFRYLTFVARCWILNTGYWILDIRYGLQVGREIDRYQKAYDSPQQADRNPETLYGNEVG
ncbi:MAG: hypothetical protein KAU38_15630 [Desulfobacterales bacterium]|nr:hypothetical protein [Desulfobacterales bacterium]